MSALPPKADIAQRGSGVRYVPIADISGRSHLRSDLTVGYRGIRTSMKSACSVNRQTW